MFQSTGADDAESTGQSFLEVLGTVREGMRRGGGCGIRDLRFWIL